MATQEIITRLQNTIDGKKALAKDILRHIQLETNPQSLFLLNAQLQFLELNIHELDTIRSDLVKDAEAVQPTTTSPTVVLLDDAIALADTLTENTATTAVPDDTQSVTEESVPTTPTATTKTRKTK